MDAARQLKPFRGARLNRTHPLAKGLVGCWIFNEGSGDKVYDLSGYGNHGTLTNMDPATDWIGGKHGWALEFDGAIDHIRVADSSLWAFGTNAFSMSISVIARSLSSSWDSMLDTRSGNFNTGLWLGSYDRKLQIYGSTAWWTGEATLDDNVWYRVTVVGDRPNVKVFLNAEQDGTTWVTDYNFTSGLLRIGGYWGTDLLSWPGRVADVYVYNRALAAEEIAWLNEEPFCMFEEPTPRSIFIMPGNPWWYYRANARRRSM